MKTKTLILVATLILCCLLCSCSKKKQSGDQQQTTRTNEQKIDAQQLDSKDAPSLDDVNDPRLKKAIEKTLDSRTAERRPRED